MHACWAVCCPRPLEVTCIRRGGAFGQAHWCMYLVMAPGTRVLYPSLHECPSCKCGQAMRDTHHREGLPLNVACLVVFFATAFMR